MSCRWGPAGRDQGLTAGPALFADEADGAVENECAAAAVNACVPSDETEMLCICYARTYKDENRALW